MSVDVFHEISGPEEAPTVVLSSSLGTTAEMWEPQVVPLSERFRVVRYDMRGHGRSPVPEGPYSMEDLGADALALLDRLGLERVSWAGVSIGGMIGMWLAINAPERIDRLVLICTSAHLPPREGWYERAETVRSAGSAEPLADTVVGRWLAPEFAAGHPAERDRLRAMLVAQPADGYAATCAAIAEMDLRPGLRTIAADTLVIGGRLDEATPADEHARVIAEAIPTVRYWVVEGAHLANIDQADTVTHLIIEHIGGQQG